MRGYIEEVQALLGLTGALVDGLIWNETRSKIPDAGKLTTEAITKLFDDGLKIAAKKPTEPSLFETLLLKDEAGQTRLKSIQKELGKEQTGKLDDAERVAINARRKELGLPQTGYLTRLLARMIEAAKSSKEASDKKPPAPQAAPVKKVEGG